MTKEEAIGKWIYPAIATMWNEKKCNEILEALEQEPCEDAISRETARRIVDSGRTKKQMIDMMLATPPVTPEPKTGHWITKFHGFPPEPSTFCSECGFDRDFYVDFKGWDKINYCPSCGKKMKKHKTVEHCRKAESEVEE